MKRKILPLLLGLSLCLSLLPVAFASEASASETEFTDVPAGSWFESGVKLCAEKGIMIGIGDGTFAPDKTLTSAECLTLALRLYDLQRGGDGVLEQLPDIWDDVTVTTADGSSVSGKLHDTFVYHYGSAKFNTAPGLQLRLTPDQVEWAKAQDSKDASITLLGKTYPAWATFAGSDDGASSILFFYSPELSGGNNVLAELDLCLQHRGWWTNSLGHAFRLGLVDHDAHYGFWDLAESTGPVTADMGTARFVFALALAEAAGDLPALKKMESIPDLERYFWSVDNSGTYMLYEAGVLTGKDESGNFDPLGDLTRAEAAVMVARVLDPTLRIGEGNTPVAQPSQQPTAPGMTTSEVELEVNRDFSSYDEALAEVRNHFGYHNERLFDTDICTVVVNDYGGMMHAQKGCITVIYKSGSAQGDGAILSPPHPGNSYSPLLSRNPDSMELSQDKKTFTYTYTFDEELLYENVPIRGKGTFTYVFDIPSGKVTRTGPVPSTVSYADALAKVVNEEDFTVERTLESPYCTIVLGYYTLTDGIKNYAMYYVYKAADTNASDTPEGTVRREVLSYTNSYVDDPATGHVSLCIDRVPDTLVLSKDGSTLFFSYDLGSGPLTELTGGGVHSTVRDLPSGSATYYTPEETAEVLSKGTVVEKKLENDDAVALLVYDEPHGVKDYALYLIDKDTGLVRGCILPSTQVITLSDGGTYAPTTLAPNRMALSYYWLGYHYRFDAPLGDYHDAGLYSYNASPTFDSVQHYSGQYDRAFEEYWLDEADILFETAECSVLQTTSRSRMAPPSTVLSLLYKAGSAMGEGIHINLPNLKHYPDYAASIRHDSRCNPPDSVSLSDDGKTLTYTYKVQWPVTDYRYENGETVEYVEVPVGTYTYTVELATGEWSQSYLAE